MEQTRPSAVVRSHEELGRELVGDCTVAELLTVAGARLAAQREGLSTLPRSEGGPISREYALAITHVEDAITRSNKANYRLAGIFAITDAERTEA